MLYTFQFNVTKGILCKTFAQKAVFKGFYVLCVCVCLSIKTQKLLYQKQLKVSQFIYQHKIIIKRDKKRRYMLYVTTTTATEIKSK